MSIQCWQCSTQYIHKLRSIMSEICQEVNQENFESLFLEHSQQYPVLVVFWAPSVPQSHALLASVEQAAIPYKDKMIFSKVNCELFPHIAQQFNVKSLPTVVLVKDAQPVDGFEGEASEDKIALFIDPHLPKAWEVDFKQALQMIESNNFQDAVGLLASALEQSGQRHDIKMYYIQSLLETQQIPQAQLLLDAVPYVEQDEHHAQLMALLEVKLQAQNSPELQLLREQYLQSPDDVELLKTYGAKLSELGRHTDALALLYGFMLENKQETQVRALYLDVIKMADSKTAADYQRKLYALLY